jgi:hypothetical protein
VKSYTKDLPMGRSRKTSRRQIAIDGRRYRWQVSPDDGFIALVVQAESGRGQRLWVSFHYGDDRVLLADGSSGSAGHRLILPQVVRLAILEGLRQGWDPMVAKPSLFRLFGCDNLLSADQWPRCTLT